MLNYSMDNMSWRILYSKGSNITKTLLQKLKEDDNILFLGLFNKSKMGDIKTWLPQFTHVNAVGSYFQPCYAYYITKDKYLEKHTLQEYNVKYNKSKKWLNNILQSTSQLLEKCHQY